MKISARGSASGILYLVIILSVLLIGSNAIGSSEYSVQRGAAVIAEGADSITLLAGLDYVSPSGPAFVRITDTRLSGMGATSGGGKQDADRWMVWISDAINLDDSFTFSRFANQGDTGITWELVEYVGGPGGENEIVVHAVATLSFPEWSLEEDGALVTGVASDRDIVVFITGQAADDNHSIGAYLGMSTASWNSTSDQPHFVRGGSGSGAMVSYAVVEFVGTKWSVERIEHSYMSAGFEETEAILSIDDISRAFFHMQHRSEGSRVDQMGAEVWLSDVNTISFQLQDSAPNPESIASVAWIVSNDEITPGRLSVQHVTGQRSPVGSEEDIWSATISSVSSSGASIMGENARCEGTDEFPRGSIAMYISDDTEVELRQSDAEGTRLYRFSIVQWPGSGLSGVIDQQLPAHDPLVLDQNVPNPFNPITKIAYDVANDAHVRLTVYDLSGRFVRSLVDEWEMALEYNEVIWDGRDSAGRMSSAGVYLYRLEAGGYVETLRMTLVK